jgi:uncharacterized membrane protein required for colicin V production
MTIIIDIIVVALILLSTFLGYKKGLIGVAFKIVSFIIAIVISLLLYKPVSSIIIEKTDWDDNIESAIYEKIAGTNVEQGEKIEEEDTDLPGILVNYINDSVENTVKEAKVNIAQTVSKDLSKNVIQIITMIVIFIVARIVLIFAKVLLEAIAELPIVKQFNEVGGILYGLLRGLFIIFVLLALASVLLPIFNQTAILTYIDQSIITKFLYNNNIILMLFF